MIFTAEIAKQYLAKNKCSRRISSRRVTELAQCMEYNEFYTTGTVIDLDYEDNLIGGQHILAAIVECGIPQDLEVRVQ